MKVIEWLAKQFDHETKTTRRHLERLPEDKLDWQPHEKSYTAGALASHLVECVNWTTDIFTKNEVNFDPATYKPYLAASTTELLEAFDKAVADGKRVLEGVDDEAAMQLWSLKFGGKTLFERPRMDVFRDFTLSHLIHHRGQYSVYLRLLNVPVPSSYGPTADEQG
ncbi:MAG TPA: DinB family protein [Pyrinomonadaceae bacterium]|nr:DinB family protein [Pyrinomonadaceae bacterium]